MIRPTSESSPTTAMNLSQPNLSQQSTPALWHRSWGMQWARSTRIVPNNQSRHCGTGHGGCNGQEAHGLSPTINPSIVAQVMGDAMGKKHTDCPQQSLPGNVAQVMGDAMGKKHTEYAGMLLNLAALLRKQTDRSQDAIALLQECVSYMRPSPQASLQVRSSSGPQSQIHLFITRYLCKISELRPSITVRLGHQNRPVPQSQIQMVITIYLCKMLELRPSITNRLGH